VTETRPPTKVDARRHPRYEVSIPADCSTRKSFFSNQVRNISRGGLFIRSDTPLPLDAEVSLVLRLPGTGRSIFASGRVVWHCSIESAASNTVPGSGIRFAGMTASDRATLESYLAGLTPAPTRLPTPH